MVKPQAWQTRRIVDEDESSQEIPKLQHGKVTRKSKARSMKINPSNVDPDETNNLNGVSGASQSGSPAPAHKPKTIPTDSHAKADANKKTIRSFFNTVSQVNRKRSDSPSLRSLSEKDDEQKLVQEISSDSDENHPILHKAQTWKGGNTTKRPREETTLATNARFPDGLRAGAQKFRRISNDERIATGPNDKNLADLRPWNEKYGPQSVEELAVHKKKVADVRQWLESALFKQNPQRLLVLKGPAGTGKTATMSALSKALNFDIVEWSNPVMDDYASEDYTSVLTRFEEFISLGATFGSLELSNSRLETSAIAGHPKKPADKSVFLVEELPNTFGSSRESLLNFRACLLRHVSRASRQTIPMVLIVSESGSASGQLSPDSITAHRLLGPELLHHPLVYTIEFNRTAQTFVTKGLQSALQKHSQAIGAHMSPGSDSIGILAEYGDIRNAVAALEFICVHQPSSLPAVNTKQSKGKAKAKEKKSARGNDSISLTDIISSRQTHLGLFHAVGKVMYNKRSHPADDSETQALPRLRRPFAPDADCDTLYAEFATDVPMFMAALHENLVLSCLPPSGSLEAFLDNSAACFDALGDADILTSSAESKGLGSFAGLRNAEGLTQSELAFHAGIRGVLFALPSPVQRQTPPGKSKADAHRMFYPTSHKLWKEKEEVKGLLEWSVERVGAGTLLAGVPLEKMRAAARDLFRPVAVPARTLPERPRIISQPGRMPGLGKTSPAKGTNDDIPALLQALESSMDDLDEQEEEREPPMVVSLGSGHSARTEMLLERLPYIAHVLRGISASSAMCLPPGSQAMRLVQTLLAQAEGVTKFGGVQVLQDENDEDEDDANGVAALTTSKVRLAREGGVKGWNDLVTEQDLDLGEEGVEKLVLSDDDIEDDDAE